MSYTFNLSQQFIKDAMRTNNPQAGQYGNCRSNMVIHALLGVVDETGELLSAEDPVNMLEELGDLRWFLALFQQATDVQLDIDNGRYDSGAIDGWCYTLVSKAKRIFAYGESVEKHLQELTYILQDLAKTLSMMCQGHSKKVDVTSIAESAVINKLRARFPQKFTEEHASNRDLGYEREVLEQSIPDKVKK